MDASRLIVESTTEYAMLFLDATGVIRSWNAGARRVFGYETDEVVGRHYSLLFGAEDIATEVPANELRQAVAEGKASNSRWLARKGGGAFWAEGVTTAVLEEGTLVGFAKIVRDASERHRLEQLLERSTEEKEKFAYTVSHDLKEPLRTVRSYSELLQRRYQGRLDADADEFIQFIIEGVARMDRLLADILAYSQAGRHDRTRPEPTQSANVLQWAIMNVDGLAKQKGAAITWDPLPTVFADQTQLATLLQHLLTNSIKFHGAEPPRIHISAEHETPDMWTFAVRDNGTGVQTDQTERVFGVFKRLVDRSVPGTGIGLAICRKIVEAHGGRIWIESEPGKGATVKFTLPAYED